MMDSELSQGLNPKPPQLALVRRAPGEQFWIVKHGIKMTGMPAWGLSHSDAKIWELVAFLQKLPELSAVEYRTMTARAEAPAEHGHERDHQH
jgi:mono/diheme cytochrome c family protein